MPALPAPAQTPAPRKAQPCVYACTQPEGCFFASDCPPPRSWRLARKGDLFSVEKCRPLAGDDGWECVTCPRGHAPGGGPSHPVPPCPDAVRR
jgi:hypothetical protein